MFDRLKDWWWEVKWWWGNSWLGGMVEEARSNFWDKVGMTCFMCLMVVGIIIMSPVLLPFCLIYGIVWLCTHIKDACIGVYEFCRDKVAITLVCTLAGMLLGVCGGTTGASVGAALGFFIGVIFEMIRWTDNGTVYSAGSSKQGNWFGLPFDEGDPQPQTTYGNGLIKVRTYEKPWNWRGFQVQDGPKEDKLLRE